MVGFGLAKKSGALLTELLGPGRVTVRPGQLRAHRWHRAHTLPGLIQAAGPSLASCAHIAGADSGCGPMAGIVRTHCRS